MQKDDEFVEKLNENDARPRLSFIAIFHGYFENKMVDNYINPLCGYD